MQVGGSSHMAHEMQPSMLLRLHTTNLVGKKGDASAFTEHVLRVCGLVLSHLLMCAMHMVEAALVRLRTAHASSF